MKSKFLLITALTLVFGCATLKSQTNVSGLISTNTTWTLAGSPYIIIGNTMVDNGINLTIEAGVTVKFDNLMALQINGELVAIGNSSNEIIFTSNKSTPAVGDWGFIMFNNSSTDATYDLSGNYTGGCVLEYCTVEYTGGGTNATGAIIIDNALPFINFCKIQHSTTSGINASISSGTLKITNNEINNNSSSGIRIYGGYAIISDNYIHDNYAASYGGGGIFTISNTSEIFNNNITSNKALGYSAGGGGGGIYIREGNSTISKNIIQNNILTNLTQGQGGGILIYYNCTVSICNNVITNNKAGYGGGIYSIEGTSTIFNNTISDNTAKISGGIYGDANNVFNNSIIYNTAQKGSAIITAYYPITGNYTYNTFFGNIATDPAPVHTIIISSNPLFNFNNIFNNTATYELNNGNDNTAANLDANNNWWGTSVDAQIQGKIFDWFDDASFGVVDYTPFSSNIRTDAPVSPPMGFTIVPGSGQISLNWNANTESDIAGYKVYWGATDNYPYENSLDIGNVTSYTITGLPAGTFFANVTAYDNAADTVTDNPTTIVNETQCAGNESWFAKELSIVGISESYAENKLSVDVYPNPAKNSINLIFPEQSQIDVLNIEGQILKTLFSKENNVSIDISGFARGLYFVKVQNKNGIAVKKFIKE